MNLELFIFHRVLNTGTTNCHFYELYILPATLGEWDVVVFTTPHCLLTLDDQMSQRPYEDVGPEVDEHSGYRSGLMPDDLAEANIEDANGTLADPVARESLTVEYLAEFFSEEELAKIRCTIPFEHASHDYRPISSMERLANIRRDAEQALVPRTLSAPTRCTCITCLIGGADL